MMSIEQYNCKDNSRMEIVSSAETNSPQGTNSIADFEITEAKKETKQSRKSCLRFCRKLIKFMGIFQKTSDFDKILDYSFTTIQDTLRLLPIKIVNETYFKQLQKELHQAIWKSFKKSTGSANPKICLITFTEWDSVFSYAGFCEKLRVLSGDYKLIEKCVEYQSKTEFQLLIGFFIRIQYIAYMILINTVIMQEMLPFYRYQKSEWILDNCMLLANFSNLYVHYNHVMGKFATECCGKCKVCRSTTLPMDFGSRLENGRRYIREMKVLYAGFIYKKDNDVLNYEKCALLFNIFSNCLSDRLAIENSF